RWHRPRESPGANRPEKDLRTGPKEVFMKHPLRRTALALTLGLGMVSSAFAGTTGKLSGVVTDGRSPLPGVTVTATSPSQIGGAQVTTTDEAGNYSFPQL